MPQTQAKAAFGTRLFRGNGADPEVFAAIAEVSDISGPAKSLLTEDATHMESPNAYAEVIPTIKEAGPVTMSVSYLQDDAGHAALDADLEAGTLRNWRIVLPSQTKRISFAGYVTGISPSHPVRGKLTAEVTITVTGKPVREPHS